ncbi:MAG: hypothetical protein RR816_04555 [Clostridia bacterium]
MKKTMNVRAKTLQRLFLGLFCFALAAGIGVGASAYLQPAAYVSLDVNPSIEYTLNTFDQVLSVHAVNDDGQKILQKLSLADLNNATIDEAIEATLAEIAKEGYFDGGTKSGVVVSACGEDALKTDAIAERLEDVIAANCLANKRDATVESIAVTQAQLDEANLMGVTPGKMLLVQRMMAENPGSEPINMAEWLQKPVKDILAEAERLELLEDEAENAADAAEDAADEAKDAAEEAKEAAEETAEEEKEAADLAKDEAKEAAEVAKDEAKEAADKAAEAKKDAADAAKEEAAKAAEAKKDAEDAAKAEAKQAQEAKQEAADIAKEEAKEAAERAKEEAKEAAEKAKEEAKEQEEPAEAPEPEEPAEAEGEE